MEPFRPSLCAIENMLAGFEVDGPGGVALVAILLSALIGFVTPAAADPAGDSAVYRPLEGGASSEVDRGPYNILDQLIYIFPRGQRDIRSPSLESRKAAPKPPPNLK